MLLLTHRENYSEVWKTGATAQSRCGQTQTQTDELTNIKYPPPPPSVIRGLFQHKHGSALTAKHQPQVEIIAS